MLLAAILLACDPDQADRAADARGGDWRAPKRSPVLTRLDCRDAHFCYRSCQGQAFLDGHSAAAMHNACSDACEPEVLAGGPATTELDHWSWWVSAVETQCEDDWSDACVLAAMVPDLHGDGGDLSGIVLDACLHPRR